MEERTEGARLPSMPEQSATKAKTRETPEGERRRKRKMLLAKLKRLEARIVRDQKTHAEVCEELKALGSS